MGFDWDINKEQKLQKAYKIGRADLFHHFIDVKKQAEVMGYYDFSLQSLSLQLLDFEPPRPESVRLFVTSFNELSCPCLLLEEKQTYFLLWCSQMKDLLRSSRLLEDHSYLQNV